MDLQSVPYEAVLFYVAANKAVSFFHIQTPYFVLMAILRNEYLLSFRLVVW